MASLLGRRPPSSPLSASSSEEERSLQNWRELVQASVECELCNEPYGDEPEHVPRLLVCGHTFCQVLSSRQSVRR